MAQPDPIPRVRLRSLLKGIGKHSIGQASHAVRQQDKLGRYLRRAATVRDTDRRPELNQQVTHYYLAWNPNARQGFATIVVQGGNKIGVPVKSPEEFNALVAVLRESPVFIRGDGLIYTGWEPVTDQPAA